MGTRAPRLVSFSTLAEFLTFKTTNKINGPETHNMLSNICPYLPVAYSTELDKLIESDEPNCISHIQRLVFHIETNGELVDNFTPKQLFMMNDATLATFLDNSAQTSKQEEIKKFEEMLQEATIMCKSDYKAMICSKCKHGNDVTWTQAQTRSADEGAKTFCSCLCGKRWNM
jgi:DNA-directed RNA polymerase subunit M/transcription elongation factor TFIIS